MIYSRYRRKMFMQKHWGKITAVVFIASVLLTGTMDYQDQVMGSEETRCRVEA